MSKRKRVLLSKEIWAGHIEAWQRSGESQRAYCDTHGLPLSNFGVWRRRLALAAAARTEDFVEIVPVRSHTMSGVAGTTPIILWLGGGRYRLDVGDGFNQDTLSQVVQVLGTW